VGHHRQFGQLSKGRKILGVIFENWEKRDCCVRIQGGREGDESFGKLRLDGPKKQILYF